MACGQARASSEPSALPLRGQRAYRMADGRRNKDSRGAHASV